MKNLVTLFILILFSVPAKAEYESYQITFTIEKINGQKYEGYVHIPTAYFKIDSIQNPVYLKRALNWHDGWENEDYLTYFKERLVYNYKSSITGIPQETYGYYLTGRTKISTNSIKKIIIDEIIDWNYTTSILVLEESSDLTWLKTEPITTYFASSFMCEEIQIFVHEKNDTIDKLVNKLIELYREIDEIEANYDEVELFNKLAYKLDDIYEKMKGYKVVIVSFCLG